MTYGWFASKNSMTPSLALWTNGVFVLTTIPGAHGIAQLATTINTNKSSYQVSATALPPLNTSDNSLRYSICHDNSIYSSVCFCVGTWVFVLLPFRTLGLRLRPARPWPFCHRLWSQFRLFWVLKRRIVGFGGDVSYIGGVDEPRGRLFEGAFPDDGRCKLPRQSSELGRCRWRKIREMVANQRVVNQAAELRRICTVSTATG